jgi:hypothetical protein
LPCDLQESYAQYGLPPATTPIEILRLAEELNPTAIFAIYAEGVGRFVPILHQAHIDVLWALYIFVRRTSTGLDVDAYAYTENPGLRTFKLAWTYYPEESFTIKVDDTHTDVYAVFRTPHVGGNGIGVLVQISLNGSSIECDYGVLREGYVTPVIAVHAASTIGVKSLGGTCRAGLF